MARVQIFIFGTGGFMKSLYDINNRAGNQSIYIYSSNKNQLLRYFTSSIAFLLLLSAISNICSYK
jgi:hypothetical protein